MNLGGNATGVSSAVAGGGGGGVPVPMVDISMYEVLDVTDIVTDIVDLTSGIGNLSHASKYGIKGYSSLRNDLAGTGLEAHHIVEARFLKGLNLNTQNALSVAVTKEEHQRFTNHWRQLYAYGKTDYDNLNIEQLWEDAQKVYHGYPDLLEVVWDTLF